MKLTNFKIVAISLLFLVSSSQALELKSDYYVACELKTAKGLIIRTIAIHKVPDTKNIKYVTIYRKSGKDKIVASGKILLFNKNIATNIKKNLEEKLWICKTSENVKIFYSDKKILQPKKRPIQ